MTAITGHYPARPLSDLLREHRPELADELRALFRAREPELARELDALIETPCGPGCRACPETAREAAQEPAGRPPGG
jgi:hypothetical protein